MQDVTDRFLAFCDYVIRTQTPTLAGEIVKSRSDFAKKAGKGASVMTEMNMKRQQLGIELLQKSVMLFPKMNVVYILTGQGEGMLLEDNPANNTPTSMAAEPQEPYTLTQKNELQETIHILVEHIVDKLPNLNQIQLLQNRVEDIEKKLKN